MSELEHHDGQGIILWAVIMAMMILIFAAGLGLGMKIGEGRARNPEVVEINHPTNYAW